MPDKKWVVEIDCWPMPTPRPNEYYATVIKGLDEWLDKEPSGKAFGCWTWQFETSEEDYLRLQPILFERLSQHYTDDNLNTHFGMRFISVGEYEPPPMPDEDRRVPVA